MKHNKIFLIILLLIPLTLFSTPDISMEVTRFRTDGENYIEVSLYIVGTSLICTGEQGGMYGLEYRVFIRSDNENIVAGNRYRLGREGCPAQDIFDVRRFTLTKGTYVVEIEAFDFFDTLQIVTIHQPVQIPSHGEGAALSDIQLLSAIESQPEASSPFHKSGLYLEPLPFRFYYPALQQLSLYVEAYHTDKLVGQPYLQYTIRPAGGDVPSPVIAHKKVRKEAVTANVFQLDISTLISGPYVLEAGLYDGQKQIRDSRIIEFSRFNPEGDSLFLETSMLQLDFGFAQTIPEDSLEYSLRAMAPIIGSMDVDIMNSLLQKGNSKAKRFFIHRYWTNEAGKLAGPAFYSYMKVAKVVDASYRSGFGYGFETDRGHIFLKYGKPDDVISVEDEPSAPPYEIWFYNSFPATHQNNVRFLFYNPSLVKGGHLLLHSTALGEKTNDRWEIELYRDAALEKPGVNDRVMGENVHRNARKYFEN